MIQNLVTWFKVAAKAHGHPVALYDYPELANDLPKARLLQQLNQRVKTDPNVSIPSGFVKSTELQYYKEYDTQHVTRNKFS